MFQVLGRQKAFLIFDAGMLVVGGAAIGLGALTAAPAAVGSYVVAVTVGYLAQIAFIAREVSRDRPDALVESNPA
jgi:hypothetical protein